VQFHFGNVLSKLGAANRHEAVAIALSAGIIERKASAAESCLAPATHSITERD
jgi:hypothetical protein